MANSIPFHRPYFPATSLINISRLLNEGGSERKNFLQLCTDFIKKLNPGHNVFMTSSCTQALEFAAMAILVGPEDEIILPSYTFVSSALPFYNRGARIRFADVDPVTMNIAAASIKKLLTVKTKAIVLTHYAGLPCQRDEILQLASDNGVYIIEDCAHAFGSSFDGKHTGSEADISCYSFHHTKNATCGEGGAISFGPRMKDLERYSEIFNKGTNFHLMTQGLRKNYEWVGFGSNFNMSEINAALLFPQMEMIHEINLKRGQIWHQYAEALATAKSHGQIDFPEFHEKIDHGFHIFHFLCDSIARAEKFIEFAQANEISVLSHYIPLHLTKPAQNEIHECPVAESSYKRLIRLPLFFQMSEDQVQKVIKILKGFFHA